MRQVQLMAVAMIVLGWQAPATGILAQTPKEHRAVAAKWEDGKPVVTAGELGGPQHEAGDYLLHFPEGVQLKRDNAELCKRDKGVLRRVKDDNGQPIRFCYPVLHDFEGSLYVEARTGPGEGKDAKDAAIWYINGLKAGPVSVNGVAVTGSRIDFCGGRRPHFIAHTDRRILHNLIGPMATVVADMTSVLPREGRHKVIAEPGDILVVLEHGDGKGEAAVLHQFEYQFNRAKLVPVNLKDGGPFKAPRLGIRETWLDTFVWTTDEKNVGTLWLYYDRAVRPIPMPGGGGADNIDLESLRPLGDRLVFSRTSPDDKLSYQWIVGTGPAEPVLTREGAQLRGPSVTWQGDSGALVACVKETPQAIDGALWLLTGGKGGRARALVGTDGKPMRAAAAAVDSRGLLVALLPAAGSSPESQFWLLDKEGNLGPILREDGKVLAGPQISASSGSNGVYVRETRDKQTLLFWLPRP